MAYELKTLLRQKVEAHLDELQMLSDVISITGNLSIELWDMVQTTEMALTLTK
ncbi:MAG: hypothetical protein WBZ48_12785 [Bacteroidota bacterium]